MRFCIISATVFFFGALIKGFEINGKVLIFRSMKFESALVNGLIGDFSTVLAMILDYIIFNISLNVWQIFGFALVTFTVLSISFGKID